MQKRFLPAIGLCLLITLSMLSGCGLFNPPSAQQESGVDDFIDALRWQNYPAAARHLAPEHQKAFLDLFSPMKDLKITDVQLEAVTLSNEGRRAETTIRMEYYLLPSATVKTFRFDQTWEYLTHGGQDKDRYLVVTPFPPFP